MKAKQLKLPFPGPEKIIQRIRDRITSRIEEETQRSGNTVRSPMININQKFKT